MPEPLRIAIPIHSFEPGGVERVALNLATEWQAAGHDVRIILGRDEGADCSRAPRDLDYWLTPSPVPTAAFETLWMMWCLARYLIREKADVIYCAGNTYAVVCVVMRLLLRGKCPPVLVKISNDLYRRDLPPGYRHLYHLWLKIQGAALDHFVALAEPMNDEIVKALGVGPDRVVTIQDPALTQARCEALRAIVRAPVLPADRGLRFVAVGRLARQKNLPLLIKAFALGSRPEDVLTIVGEGAQRGNLERLVRDASMQDRIRFVGNVQDPDIYFRDADVMVLSSDYEGVPAVVIEAIAAGLPVIATRCSSSMDMLLGYGTRGVLVPIRDAKALAAAIGAANQLAVPDDGLRAYAAQFTAESAALSYVASMQLLRPRDRTTTGDRVQPLAM